MPTTSVVSPSQIPGKMCDGLVQLHSSCHHTNLLNAMWALRTMGTLCDITVQVTCHGELEEFEAHQVVLAASSGYFKSRLLSGNQLTKLFLCDITPDAFAKFLEYVYSGKIEVDRGYVGVILKMAQLLDCQDLVDACVSELPESDARIACAVSDECLKKDEADLNTSRSPIKIIKVIVKKSKLLACQDLVDACGSELPSSAVVDERLKKDEVDLNASSAPVKRKKEQLKRDVKQVKMLEKLEKVKEIVPDTQSRRSTRLAGRRVSVDFPLKKSETQTDTSDESDTEEQTSQDPEVETQDVSGETPGEKEACDDSETESPHSAPDEDPQESDFVPNEEMDDADEADEADEEEKESKKGSSKYRCEECSRSFHYEKSYLKHLSVNHGVQMDTTLRCDVCHQTFRNRGNLKIHKQHVHNDVRLFPCDICSKTFKRKKDVTRHRRQVHEGGMDRHFCDICGKSLSSKTALTLHERTHTGHKPFKCDECGTCFAQSSALKTHQR